MVADRICHNFSAFKLSTMDFVWHSNSIIAEVIIIRC